MKKIWVNKVGSFKQAGRFERDYYRLMSPSERLETVQFLRESFKIKKGKRNEDRKGLRRVVRIIQQK